MTTMMLLTLLMVCASIGLSHSHTRQSPKALCVIGLCFHLALVLCHPLPHTAFVNAVCQGLRPRVSGCSAEMKALVSACWDAKASCRPCLSSFPLFSIFSLFFLFFLFTINFVGFCQRTTRQRANHTVSEERGGDYRAMASSQGVLSEGEKREKEGGF